MAYQGAVKLFNPNKGFGFITAADGSDVFLHIGSCTDGGVPQQGDTVAFDLEESKIKPGQMQAANVTGGTGVPGAKGGGKGGGANQGTVKQYNADKGFGFIFGADGTELFFHVKGMADGSTPQAGDTLNFDLEPSRLKPGQMQAQNITGGTGWAANGKGSGKDGGYGAAKGGWGGGDSPGPYGGGKDSGKGGKNGKMEAMMAMMSSMWGGSDDSWGGGDSWGGKGGSIENLKRTLANMGVLPGGKGKGFPKTEVFVRGLPPDTSDKDVQELFSPFGAIPPRGVKAMLNEEGQCKGIAFVDFMEESAAQAAISALNGAMTPDGSQLGVHLKNSNRKGKGGGKDGGKE